MLTRGIVMIAMGAEYEKLAAATIRHSMLHTSLPFAVVFNNDTPAGDWSGLIVHRIIVDCQTDKNRLIKTQLYKYTPYIQTMYMDVDAVIQASGIERVFDGLQNAPAVFQRHTTWSKFKKYYDIYRRAIIQFDSALPVDIMLGGFFAFNRDPRVAAFFDLWRNYWVSFGCGRDMPPLACAVKNSGLPYHTITCQVDKLFSFGYRGDCIAVHRVRGDDLQKKFNIPEHKQNKPFDIGHKDDWAMVYLDKLNNDWLKKKVDIVKQESRERRYINENLPKMLSGGLRVLDIGCGFGQFLYIARRYGNTCLGVMPPLEKYETKSGIPNSDSLEYELFCRERMEKIKVPFVECDIEDVLYNEGIFPVSGFFDVINCKHALNLMLRRCFDFGVDIANYDNKGAWILDDSFRATMRRFLTVVMDKLAIGGVFMLAALTATNTLEYSDEVVSIAGSMGLKIETLNRGLNHRFTRVA